MAKEEVNVNDSLEDDIPEEIAGPEGVQEEKPSEEQPAEETVEEEKREIEVEEEPSEPSTDDEEEPSQPEPVEGETPKERALRKQVEKLRKERRESRSQISDKPKVEDIKDPYEGVKDVYSQDEIDNLEKVIDAVARKKGYVKKEESYKETVNDILDDFIEDNKEYNPSNDPDNIRWDTFHDILVKDYNINGKTPRQVKAIFKKVHRDVNDELGEVETPSKGVNKRQIDAQKQKIKSVSHSSGSTKSTDTKKKSDSSYDPATKTAGGVKMVGFEDLFEEE
jgi:hypothetical protein